jgi:transposase
MADAHNFSLESQRLGPLPIINQFIDRLGLEKLLQKYLPPPDERTRVPYEKALGVLVRSILVEREPIYRQQEVVLAYCPRVFGLTSRQAENLTDDAVGRALDRLFSADHRSLLTEVVVAARRHFNVSLDELHNDSTTVRLTGQYSEARGRSIRGKRAPWVTYGDSKDRRPDLKQLLLNLTTTADGDVPVHMWCGDGNTSDSNTHLDTWRALRDLHGKPDFLYVADSKLCGEESMLEIAAAGGRLVTVMPRTRNEDKQFRARIQEDAVPWEKGWDRPNPRGKYKPRDMWFVYRDQVPSKENWPVIWVFSTLLRDHQGRRRQDRIARAQQELAKLKGQVEGPRSRMRSQPLIEAKVERILGRFRVRRYIRAWVAVGIDAKFRQDRPGRPGPNTRYVRKIRRKHTLHWEIDEQPIEYDKKSDGMYPLLTNARNLTPLQVLEAHKRQPGVEKRFQRAKSVHEIAPVLLKNESRIEAFFLVYFIALLLEALVEREIRLSMRREGIKSLPIYPEERKSTRPTGPTIFRLFSLVARHVVRKGDTEAQAFEAQLTDLQKEVLRLLKVSTKCYRPPAEAGRNSVETPDLIRGM